METHVHPFLAILQPLTYMLVYFGSCIVKPKSWMLNLLPNQNSAIIKDLRLLFCVRHLPTERRLHLQVCPCDMLSSPMTLIYQFEILPFAIVLQFFYRGGDVQYCTNCHFLQKISHSLQRLGCNWKLIFTNSSRLLTLTQSSKDLR